MNRRLMYGGAETMKYGPLIYARGIPNYYNGNLHWDYYSPLNRASIWCNYGELFPTYDAQGATDRVQNIAHPIPIPAGSETVTINIEPLTSIDYMLNFYHIDNGVWIADSTNSWVNNSGEITANIPVGSTYLTIGLQGANNTSLTINMTVKQVTIDFE